MHQDVEMRRWCQRMRTNIRVRAWLAQNPPPDDWEGTRMEWAYIEMPLFGINDYGKPQLPGGKPNAP